MMAAVQPDRLVREPGYPTLTGWEPNRRNGNNRREDSAKRHAKAKTAKKSRQAQRRRTKGKA